MSRAGNPYDNAFMESCFSRFKAELLQEGIFDTMEDARTEIFEYIGLLTEWSCKNHLLYKTLHQRKGPSYDKDG
ncbi:MAG: transposase [Thermoflavifilum aggregans]|nr:transposase [Thermoflavifilum aggregans]